MELLLANADAYAASGEWLGLRQLLVEHSDRARQHAPLALLRAQAELRTGRPREAYDWLVAVWPTIEGSGDRHRLRAALNLRGVAEVELGSLGEGEVTFGRVLELAQSDGDELLASRALNNLGAIADVRDHHDQALLSYQRAIPFYQRLGDTRGLAETCHNMAITFRHMRQFERADECERRAIAYASDAGSAVLESLARVGRAELSLLTGDAALAEATARYAAKRFAALSDPIREADALRLLAASCLALGKLPGARASLDRALELAVAHGARLIEAESRRVNAELLAATGRVEAARAEAAVAARVFESLGADAKRRETVAWRMALPAAASS
jgi:tetratricopeptide (TPR) repeat protein